MRVFFTLMFTFLWLFAKTLAPTNELIVEGNIIETVLKDGKILSTTDKGAVWIFDFKSLQNEGKVEIPEIESYYEGKIKAKIFSVDKIGETLLLMSESQDGARDLFLYKNGSLTKIIGKEKRLSIKKARFVNEKQALLALISNEVILYDLELKKEIYRKQFNTSSFSDFVISGDETALTCESGEVFLFETKSGKLIKKLEGANKDNAYKLDYKAGKIATAGQDRFAGVYDVASGSFKRFEAEFLIYAVGLSPSGSKMAYAKTQDNSISVVELNSGGEIAYLKGHKSTLNSIIFVDEETIISSGDGNKVFVWKIAK